MSKDEAQRGGEDVRVDLILSAFAGCLIGWFWLDEIAARVKSSRFFKGCARALKRSAP